MNPLETLNATLISEVTKEQFVSLANKFLSAPSLIILFISLFAIFLLIGLIFVRENRGNLIKIWVISFVLGLIILIILIFIPNLILNLTEWVRGLI